MLQAGRRRTGLATTPIIAVGCCASYRNRIPEVMLRASDGICELAAARGYVCDGELAAETQDTAALGTQSGVVKPCTEETLAKFGFQP